MNISGEYLNKLFGMRSLSQIDCGGCEMCVTYSFGQQNKRERKKIPLGLLETLKCNVNCLCAGVLAGHDRTVLHLPVGL